MLILFTRFLIVINFLFLRFTHLYLINSISNFFYNSTFNKKKNFMLEINHKREHNFGRLLTKRLLKLKYNAKK